MGRFGAQKMVLAVGAIAMVLGSATGAIAADVLKLKIGPFQQNLNLSDLETFASTGEVPSKLKPFQGLLNPNLQGFLQKSFKLDPAMANQFLDQLWRSPTGKQVLSQIQTAIPDTSIEGLQAAVGLVLNQNLEISALNLLRAYPQEELTIDLTAVAGLLLQMNLPNLQSQLLSPKLATELETAVNSSNLPNIDPTASGQQAVRRQTMTLRDHQRNRTITLDIYDSAATQDQLVVMSHGFAANRHFLQYLAEHLASHGYTVVTLDHPGSNVRSLFNASLGMDNLLPATEFVDRPKDIQFVLDQLVVLNESGDFANQFATDNVTVIGHSFGGYTALALAGATVDPPAIRAHCKQTNPLTRSPGDWLQCAAAQLPYGRLNLKDDRIKQAIALNPMIGEVFGETGLAEVTIPSLILTSTKDAITPSLQHQLEPFQQLTSEKYLVVADGATHMSATDVSNRDSVLARSTLVPELMGEEAEPVRQMVKALSLSFLERNNSGGSDYGEFLSGNYVQSLSSHQIKLRLTETISAELEKFLSNLPQAEPLVTTPAAVPQKASLFSFWRTTKPTTTKPLSYPTGVLQASFSPLMASLKVDEFEALAIVPYPENFNILYQWD